MDTKILIQFFDTKNQKDSSKFQVPITIKKKQLLELAETKGSLYVNGNIILNDLHSVLPENLNNEETVIIKISDEKEQKAAVYCSSSFSGHESAVLALASHESDLYSVGGDCTVRKWNIHTKLQVKISKEHTNWVQIVKVFDDIVCSGSLDANICVFDRNLNLLTKLIGHLDGITGIDKIGKYLISSSRDKTVKFWELSQEKIDQENVPQKDKTKYKCVYSYAHREIIMGIHVFGSKLISYSKDGQVKIYENTKFIEEFQVNSQINTVVANGADIFIGCEDGSVYKNRKVIAKLPNTVCSLSVSQNGIFLAIGSFSKKVAIFTTDGLLVVEYFHFNSVYKVKIINQLVYSAGKDKTIKIFSLKSKKIVSDLICKDEVYDFTVSDEKVIAACKDSKVYFFE